MLVARTILGTELPLIVASALVVETGGPLNHVAAQARERGIPAVVGAIGAVAAFADGNRVLVDGDAGLVGRIELRLSFFGLAVVGEVLEDRLRRGSCPRRNRRRTLRRPRESGDARGHPDLAGRRHGGRRVGRHLGGGRSATGWGIRIGPGVSHGMRMSRDEASGSTARPSPARDCRPRTRRRHERNSAPRRAGASAVTTRARWSSRAWV